MFTGSLEHFRLSSHNSVPSTYLDIQNAEILPQEATAVEP
jgi:hypothetical protein